MSNLFKKILAPIDGSKHSQKALATALDLAKVQGSALEILHVTSFSDVYMPTKESTEAPASKEPLSPQEWINDYMDKVRENGEKMLSRAREDAESRYPRLKVTAKLLVGRPGQTIINEAEEGGFDLIVIGCRGLGGLAELVLGSVSHEVVNGSKTPVLVVK